MPVFRVKKVKDYTIMPNLHLRNRQLSLRAKGLLCQMLSMPPEWNFTLQGLAYINKEGLDAITTVIHELEQAGYIISRFFLSCEGKGREMNVDNIVIHLCLNYPLSMADSQVKDLPL